MERKPSEEVRYAAHIFQKWGEVMAKRLIELRAETLKFGCETPNELSLNNLVEIRLEEAIEATIRLTVKGVGNFYPFQALIHPFFDIEKIPEIRNLVIEAVKKAERILEEAVKVDLEKQKTIKTIMPGILDELGADIMQYGSGPAKLPPHEDMEPVADQVHQAFKVTTKNQQVTPIAPPPGVTLGGVGAAAVAKLGPLKSQGPYSPAVQKARQELAEIQARINRQRNP